MNKANDVSPPPELDSLGGGGEGRGGARESSNGHLNLNYLRHYFRSVTFPTPGVRDKKHTRRLRSQCHRRPPPELDSLGGGAWGGEGRGGAEEEGHCGAKDSEGGAWEGVDGGSSGDREELRAIVYRSSCKKKVGKMA